MRMIIGLSVIVSYSVFAMLASVGAIKIAHDFAGEMESRVPPLDGVIVVVTVVAAFILMGVTAWAINKHIVEDL